MHKWKKWLPALLAAALCVTPVLSVAEEGAQPVKPLTYEEMLAWRNGFAVELRAMQILNNPMDTYNADLGEMYLVQVEDGTIDSLAPNVTEAEQITGVELSGGMMTCPRGASMGSSLETVLSYYPNHNPELLGDEMRAVLYVYAPGEYPGLNEAVYGVVMRDGPNVVAVQYTTMAPLQDGQYLEIGIQYIIEDGFVAGMRFYGYNAVISEATMREKLQIVQGDAQLTEYSPQADEGMADILMLADLRYEGIFLPTTTPDEVVLKLGEPEDVDNADQDAGDDAGIETLVYPGRTFEFTTLDGVQRLTAFTLDDEAAEGPRGLRLGMTLDAAMALFRKEVPAWQENRVFLYTYGATPEVPPFGMLEYYTTDQATLRYSVLGDDGEAWMLHIGILGGMVDEILIYRYVP